MEVICEYCNRPISDKDEKCPNCGAVNKHFRRVFNGAPSTMEELLKFYNVNFMYPFDVTRFYIGQNQNTPLSYGIYRNDDGFTVYYNDEQSVREVLYEGRDEVYAVNEMHIRMVQRLEMESREKLDYIIKERATIRKQIIEYLAIPLLCILAFVIVAIFVYFGE